ncbi:MAG: uridine phosphorylase [Gemmatimonadota bacterium]
MKHVYHLDLDDDAIAQARHALLPGDPGRVPTIARAFDDGARELAWKREYRSFRGRMEGRQVLVTSTGIGGPSASIAVDELAQLGVDTFLRVGTTGAIRQGVAVGDIVITTGAVRMDGASTHYAPIEYPAVAHHEVVGALVEAAQAEGIPHHVGVTASSDTFYPGQERHDSYAGHVLRRFRGQTDELAKLNVLNYEMESATILTMCAAFGLRGGCVTGVVARRAHEEHIMPDDLAIGERNVIRVAVAAMRRLIRSQVFDH